jgi:integrase
MLTDAKIKAADIPEAKPYKMYDRDGLFMVINPGSGAKWWRFKYRINGKEKKLSLGVYPTVSLAMARSKRDEARLLVAKGIDPSQDRQEQKAAKLVDSSALFKTVAEEWMGIHASRVSSATMAVIRARIERYVLPELGNEEVSKIDAPRALEVIRKIESTGYIQVAMRAKHDIAMVLRYGAVKGKQSRDVTVDLKGMTKAKPKTQHRPAVTTPEALGQVLRDLWAYHGTPVLRGACKLLPLTMCRPSVVASAQWEHIDMDAGLWLVPGELMKMGQPLVVPLARQAMQILKEMRTVVGPNSRYVFPHRAIDVRHIVRSSITKVFVTLGYKDIQTAHGFRATCRTLLDETLGYRPEWIELQLAHAVKGPNGEAYPRMKFLEQRRGMMQAWADYLDTLRVGK